MEIGIELAKAAASDGYRYLVAVGGDETIHEVANGILQTVNSKQTSLGIICTGTGSDLSRSIGISHDYTNACSSLTESAGLLSMLDRYNITKTANLLNATLLIPPA